MEFVEELLRRLSWEWLVGAALIILVFNNTGIVQRWFRGRSEERVAERDRISEDQEDLLDRLKAQLEQEHAWRLTDAAYYQEQISALRKQVGERDTTIATLVVTAGLSERGNARLRHALNNVFQYISTLRFTIEKGGVKLPAYNGWQEMLGLSDDLDQALHKLFESVVREPPE